MFPKKGSCGASFLHQQNTDFQIHEHILCPQNIKWLPSTNYTISVLRFGNIADLCHAILEVKKSFSCLSCSKWLRGIWGERWQ